MSNTKPSGILVARISIKDPELWQRYTIASRQTMEKYGGGVYAFDPDPVFLVGESSDEKTVLLKFPTKTELLEWYRSDDYQAIIPLRDEGALVSFIAMETLT
jgi:uncharacterized protein (DUF1330 family)